MQESREQVQAQERKQRKVQEKFSAAERESAARATHRERARSDVARSNGSGIGSGLFGEGELPGSALPLAFVMRDFAPLLPVSHRHPSPASVLRSAMISRPRFQPVAGFGFAPAQTSQR